MKRILSIGLLSTVMAITASAQPTTAPPVPAEEQAKVMSVYSAKFTPMASGIDFNPIWWDGQQTVVTEIEVAGVKVLEYKSLDFKGIDFMEDVNATQMTNIKVDMWCAENHTVKLFPICKTPTESTVEQAYDLNLKAGEWTSFDIPMSTFNSLTNYWDKTFQFKLDAAPNNGKTIYLGNLYYYAEEIKPDAVKPIMVSASLVGTGSNSAEISVSATDKDDASNSTEVTRFIVSDAANGINNVELIANDGVIALSDLTAGTTYNLTIKAKDKSSNISDNSKSLSFTTSAFVYYNFPTGQLGDANWADPAGRILLTIARESETEASVIVAPNGGVVIDKLVVYFFAPGNTVEILELGNEDGTSIAGQKLIIDDVPDWDRLHFQHIQWHSVGMAAGGRWTINDLIVKGSELYNAPTSLDSVEQLHLSIYPNPASDYMMLESDSEIAMITIRNLLGQAVKTVSVGAQAATIALDDVTQGNYFVTILTQDGNATTRKLVVR